MRVKFRQFAGLYLNTASDENPPGTVRVAANCAPFAGGVCRSAPPTALLASPAFTTLMSFAKFVGRFVARGVTTGTEQIKFETAVGSGAFTTFTNASVNNNGTENDLILSTSPTDRPMLFVAAPPVEGKDEFLFALDASTTAVHPTTPGSNGEPSNGLVKIDKANGITLWGIKPPTHAEVSPMAAGVYDPTNATTGIKTALLAQDNKYINTVATDPLEAAGDWTLTSGDEDGLSAFSSVTTSANPAVDGNSIKVRAGKNDVVVITRVLGSNVDLTTFGAVTSPEEDFIQFFVRVRRPKHLENVEIAFDTTAAGDFKDNFFSRELVFKLVKRRARKELIGLGDLIPARRRKRGRDTQEFLQDNANKLRDLTFTAEQGNQTIPVAKNTWTRVTLPKTSFDKSGVPNWATVRAIRFTVHANSQGNTAVFFDSLKLAGGVGMSGDYEYTITYRRKATLTRSNPYIDSKGVIAKTSIKDVERQGVRLTFMTTLVFDNQADELEVWRTVGNGKAYFKCGEIAVTGGNLTAGTTFDDKCSDYIGLSQTRVTDVTSGSNKSYAILDSEEELPIDNDSPNMRAFSFRDMANKIHYGRMFWARNLSVDDKREIEGVLLPAAERVQDGQGNVYYSPIGRFEAVQSYVRVTSGADDPVQKIIVWRDRLFAFTKSAVYEIVGTDEPFIVQKIDGCPGTLNPYSISPGTAGLFYAAEDGVYRFNGQYSENITDKALMPVFRYRQATENVTITGIPPNRMAAGLNALYMGSTAGGTGFVFDFDTETWRVLDAAAARWLYSDSFTGKMIAGITTLLDAEPQTYPSSGTLTFTVRMPEIRTGNGQKGVLRKLYVDLTVGALGDDGTPQISVSIDGGADIGPFTLATVAAGVRLVQELNLNRAGERFGITLSSALCRDLRLNGIEADVYVPSSPVTEHQITGPGNLR